MRSGKKCDNLITKIHLQFDYGLRFSSVRGSNCNDFLPKYHNRMCNEIEIGIYELRNKSLFY